jgi:hypothetical protein
VTTVVSEQAAGLRSPRRTVGELLDTLRDQGLVRSVAKLRELFGVVDPAFVGTNTVTLLDPSLAETLLNMSESDVLDFKRDLSARMLPLTQGRVRGALRP